MRIRIAAIGKAGRGAEAQLYDAYISRLPWPVELKQLEIKKSLDGPKRMEAEGELLLAALQGCERIIALDEKGKHLTSPQFSTQLQKWRDEGTGTLGFAIGGADGLAAAVKTKADMSLALGNLTWPHMLVRAMLAEQLYRAYTIATNHPYHRE